MRWGRPSLPTMPGSGGNLRSSSLASLSRPRRARSDNVGCDCMRLAHASRRALSAGSTRTPMWLPAMFNTLNVSGGFSLAGVDQRARQTVQRPLDDGGHGLPNRVHALLVGVGERSQAFNDRIGNPAKVILDQR